MSVCGDVGNCIEMSLPVGELGRSYTDDLVNTVCELCISRIAGAEEVIGVNLLGGPVVVFRLIDTETLKNAGKKLKRSS